MRVGTGKKSCDVHLLQCQWRKHVEIYHLNPECIFVCLSLLTHANLYKYTTTISWRTTVKHALTVKHVLNMHSGI